MNIYRSFLSNLVKSNKNCGQLIFARNISGENVEFQEKIIRVNDTDLNYLKTGNGPHKLLCLPGALGSIWTDFTPQIKGLDKNLFTIIAWDPPGYGKSIPPYREFPLNFYEKDADLALLLMRALEIQKFSLLGWSDGGISSMILAAKHPEFVKKAVIWGANSYILNTELAGYEGLRDISKWSKRMKDPMIALYGESYFAETIGKWVDAMKNIHHENRGDICMSKLVEIQCPTLLLYGAKDGLVDPQHISVLHSNIEHSISHIYPEGGHNIHLKYAEDFNKRVTEFLTKKD